MAIRLAIKTMAAIDNAIEADQGASFRGWLGKVIPHIEDAYREDNFPFRSHLGASGIGDECPRKPWYGFRWATKPHHDARLMRLFNRGHLEEARFIALLLMIGCQVYQQDENGHQFTISGAGGHFGGSGDGVVIGLPDLPQGTAALCEFKTSADKQFQKLVKEGVKEAKPEHYVQMNTYMRKMGIPVALYMAVNKNNDAIHAEIVEFDPLVADQYIDRGERLVFFDQAPEKMKNASPAFYKCRWCDHNKVCHGLQAPHRNCRTCRYAIPHTDGKWYCNHGSNPNTPMDKHQQLAACSYYTVKDLT